MPIQRNYMVQASHLQMMLQNDRYLGTVLTSNQIIFLYYYNSLEFYNIIMALIPIILLIIQREQSIILVHMSGYLNFCLNIIFIRMTQVCIPNTNTICQNYPSPETDASPQRSSPSAQEQPVQMQPSKKRVGPYSYRLADVIGSGFSSTVYKGYKDNDKSQVVALKVVKITDMKDHRRKLLENEVKILKQVEHPHIIKFLDLYYTRNNYYIITEYCEAGSLQSLIDSKKEFDWAKASYEISLACRYLAQNRIMHRDIKPANVLVKNGTFKLSDFGFTYRFQNYEILKDEYLIGSPLYMPIESLADRFYSTKSDSFALGVLIYYLVTRRFPWKGKNKQELIINYQRKGYNKKNIAHLPPRAKHLISGLLQMHPEKRMHLAECEFEVFLHVGPSTPLEEQLSTLNGKYTEQLKLCQYMDSLYKNYSIGFSDVNSYLSEYVARHLKSITVYYSWDKQDGLRKIKQNYWLPSSEESFTLDDYYWLNNCLKDTLKGLMQQKDTRSQVMLQKLLKYQQVVQSIIFQSPSQIMRRINELVLHSDYSLVRPDSYYITKTLSNIDFYPL